VNHARSLANNKNNMSEPNVILSKQIRDKKKKNNVFCKLFGFINQSSFIFQTRIQFLSERAKDFFA